MTQFEAWIQHRMKYNLDEIVSKSKMNCHVKGLHSILLADIPGNMVRMFVADRDHQMHSNHPKQMAGGMSLAFHAHHCDLTLLCTKGEPYNWIVEVGDDIPAERIMGTWKYTSGLKDGVGGFEKVGREYVSRGSFRGMYDGDPVNMKAEQIHTVYVPEGQFAAWLVFEGKEAETPNNICYSNADLNDWSPKDYYQPMPEDILRSYLRQANVYRSF